MNSDGNSSDVAKGKDCDRDHGTGGEDDGSTEKNGDDSHLHEDQKSRRLESE